mgnify:CR=1 FL=1
MEYTEKILHQSNYWYNDGLRKAKIRDISGAVQSLKRSFSITGRTSLQGTFWGLFIMKEERLRRQS